MSSRVVLAILSALAVGMPAAAQNESSLYDDMVVGESRDVPCPANLNSYFKEDRSPVEFKEHDFISSWRSVIWHFPLPSHNWYEATPSRDVVSVTGDATWQDARIQVHCWVYRSSWVIVHHYHHIASSGRLVCPDPNRALGMWDEQFDPYAPDEVQTLGLSDDVQTLGLYCEEDGGGGGGGSNGTCTPMEIQVSYDGGRTWTTVYKGNVCEAQ